MERMVPDNPFRLNEKFTKSINSEKQMKIYGVDSFSRTVGRASASAQVSINAGGAAPSP
jgi:hypothetical protein